MGELSCLHLPTIHTFNQIPALAGRSVLAYMTGVALLRALMLPAGACQQVLTAAGLC
jgi:hypothetical protein